MQALLIGPALLDVAILALVALLLIALAVLVNRRREATAVVPVREQLDRIEREIAQLERERAASEGQLRAMVDAVGAGVGRLDENTGRLAQALRSNSARGFWGEVQLRNVVELAGMLEHCDFEVQQTVGSADGALRPDMLIRLPGGRLVIVDAKTPLEEFLAAVDAPARERGAHLDRHARLVREHAGRLAAKSYQSQFGQAAEFVVMFLPAEALYQAALEREPALLEHAARRGVLIATPTSLIGLLWAVQRGWRDERAARSAREIAAQGRELHARLSRFAATLQRVGSQLDGAVDAYNTAVGSFEARLVPQARRFEQSGAGSERPLQAPAAIEVSARRVGAAAGAEDQSPRPSSAA